MENIKYIVYCTTCLKNKKIYIGVHKTNPEHFDYYIGNGCYINRPATYKFSKTKFLCAINKYGVNNFIRTTIAEFDTPEEAYLLELAIVNEKFLQRDDVYNIALGGSFTLEGHNAIVINLYDSEGNFIKSYNSIKEAALTINVNFSSIYNAYKNKTRCKNCYWSEIKLDKLDLSKMHNYNNPYKIPVFQYDDKGNYECCYESIKDAARILKVSDSNIGVAIKLGTLCYDKYFTNIYGPNFSIAKSDMIKSRPVYQYDLEGNFIAGYKNQQKAKDALGVKGDIYKAIKLGRTFLDYQWSFEKLDKIARVKPKSGKARRIGKFDLNDNLLKEYRTVLEGKDENGCNVVRALKTGNPYRGFKYKYLD